jgi:DNA-binding GntR family transcriptional regulator
MTGRDDDAWQDDLPELRPTSRVELWVQLREQLAARILDGRIPPDHKLWSQTDLAKVLHVSRGTTIRAYEGLQEEGLVIFVAGRGLFSPMAEEIEAVRTRRRDQGS